MEFLRLDHRVLVGQLEQRHGHDVEVRRHRRRERAAEAGEHSDRGHHHDAAAELVNDQRQPDAGGHHGKRRERVSHDRGEQRHADRIRRHDGERRVERNPPLDQRRDDRPDTRQREHRAERGEHLGKHGRPADGVEQATRLDDGNRPPRSDHRHPDGQRRENPDRERDERHLPRIDDRLSMPGHDLEPEGSRERDRGNRQRRHEESVSPAARACFALDRAGILGRGPAESSNHHDPDHQQHEHAVRDVGQFRAGEKGDRVRAPEQRVAESPRTRAIARAHERDAGEHQAHEHVHELERDHVASSRLASRAAPRRSERSSMRRRAPWITKAQIAVGTDHTARLVAST